MVPKYLCIAITSNLFVLLYVINTFQLENVFSRYWDCIPVFSVMIWFCGEYRNIRDLNPVVYSGQHHNNMAEHLGHHRANSDCGKNVFFPPLLSHPSYATGSIFVRIILKSGRNLLLEDADKFKFGIWPLWNSSAGHQSTATGSGSILGY